MSTPDQHRRAVLLDQYPLWLDALEHVVAKLTIEVVAKTTSPQLALAAVREHRPDLIVSSLEMPESEVDGLTVISQALSRHPDLRVIVVSAHSDPEHIEAALAAGASAYVVKTAHPDDLASAIRQAFEHSVYLAGTRFGSARSPQEPALASVGLTRRELEILQLVAEGYSNSDLAKMLWVTEQTVKFHLSNIYRKLGVSNRTEASRWAQLHGLLSTSAVASGA